MRGADEAGPAPPRTLADIDATIPLVEECGVRLRALAARLARGGRAEDAAYALTLRGLCERRLLLLRESRCRVAGIAAPARGPVGGREG